MLNKVTALNTLEINPHSFLAEASDLSLPPGQWPDRLKCSLGNQRDLIRTQKFFEDNTVILADYRQLLGCIRVRVHND